MSLTSPKRFCITVFLFLYCCIAVSRQTAVHNNQLPQKYVPDLSRPITIKAKRPKLKTLMTAVEQQSQFRFSYINSDIDDQQHISLPAQPHTVGSLIILIKTSLGFTLTLQDYMIIIKKEEPVSGKVIKQEAKEFYYWAVVVNEDGEPIDNVSVRESKTGKPPRTSGPDGRFQFRYSNEGLLLELTRKGFEPIQFLTRNRNGDSVIMTPIYNEQETAEVMGYSSTPRKFNTASIFKVTADELPRGYGNNIASALQSKVPGLSITDMNGIPGNGSSIQLRGRQSIGFFPGALNFVANTPLTLLNGVVWTMPPKRLRSLGTDPNIEGVPEGVPLNDINIEDIESITVYKDADATAIYGSRGANGVISIRTKKGGASKNGVIYSIIAEHGMGSSAFIPRFMNTSQYAEMVYEKMKNSGQPFDPTTAPELFKWSRDRNTNWPEYILGNTARIRQYHIAASGGAGNLFNFYSSAGFREETTALPVKQTNRTATFHVNAGVRAGKRSNTQFSLSLSSVDNQQPAVDPMPYIRLAPNAPALRDAKGQLVFADSGITFGNIEAQLLNQYETRTLSITSSLNTEYAIMRGLSFKVRMGLNSVQLNEKATYPIAAHASNTGATGSVESAVSNYLNISVEPQLQYLDTSYSERRTITLFVGGTLQDQSGDWNEVYRRGYKSDSYLNLPEAAAQTDRKEDNFAYRYTGLYGGANLTLQKQYVINVTGRYDGSNRFGPDHRSALFGALGTAWIFTNAQWWKDSSRILPFGKIRASIGTTGTDQSGNYSYKDSYRLLTDGSTYARTAPIRPTGLSNPGLSWERNLKKEIALDLQIKGGISMTVSWFQNLTSRQLITASLPSQTGASLLYGVNHEATVQNSGIELWLRMKKDLTPKLRWTPELNLTLPRNKLRSFKNLESSIYNRSLIVGRSLTEMQGLIVTRVNPDNGLYEFDNTTGLVPIGNLDPKLYGGFTNNFTMGQWALSIFIEGRQQKNFSPEMYGNANILGSPDDLLTNQDIYFLNRWRKTGDISSNQKFSTLDDPDYVSSTSNSMRSDKMLTDGSYIRLRYVNLSWSPPLRWITNLGLKDVKLYIRAQNLLTITGYEGGDPTIQTPVSVPSVRSCTAGIKLTL